MLLTLLNTLIISCALLGLGSFVSRYTVVQTPSRLWTDLGFGLFFVSVYSMILSFFRATSDAQAFALLVIGFGLFVWNYRKEFRGLLLLPILIFGFLLSVLAVDNNFVEDALLYHIPTLQWLKTEALVVGLANLHDRFGYNSILHNVMASFAWNFKANSFVDSVLPAILTLFFSGFVEIIRKNKMVSRVRYFAVGAFVMAFIVWGKRAMFDSLGSPMNDVTPSILAVIILTTLMIEKLNPGIAYWTIMMSLMAVMFKVSQVWLVIPSLYLVYYLFKNSKKLFWRALIGFGVVSVIWMLRGILLSGCLVFPIESTCMNVSWALPIAEVIEIKKWILSWGRYPEQHYNDVLGNLNWIGAWFKRASGIRAVQITFAIFVVGGVLGFLRRKKNPFLPNKITMISILAGFLLWLNAPDFRFATWFFIMMGGLCLGEIISFGMEKSRKLVLGIALIGSLVILQDYLRLATVVIGKFAVVKENDLSAVGELKPLSSLHGVSYFVPKGALCGFTITPCSNLERPNLAESNLWIWKSYKSVPTGL